MRTPPVFDQLDSAGQEALVRLLDQDIRTLGQALRRDEEAFLALARALLRAGYRLDPTVQALMRQVEDRL